MERFKCLMSVLMVLALFSISANAFYSTNNYGNTHSSLQSDDNYATINLGRTFQFFGNTFNKVYISTNGVLSFGSSNGIGNVGVRSYTPTPFPTGTGAETVAPYWGDFNPAISGSGDIYYLETTSQSILNAINRDVVAYSPTIQSYNSQWAFIVTWDRIPAYGTSVSAGTCSVQLTLGTDGNDYFAIFQYRELNWLYGTASSGIPAQIGFESHSNTPVEYYIVPGSRTTSISSNANSLMMFWVTGAIIPIVQPPSTSNTCGSNPCQNGGACNEGSNMYSCTCANGYEGTHCQTALDPCLATPCANGGACTSSGNSYTCQCTAQYMGTTCTVVNYCHNFACVNGDCVSGTSAATCTCQAGWDGASCSTNINECTSNPCTNGGSCVDGVNGYQCNCAAGYDGVRCGNDINECNSNPCQNGASCDEGEEINFFQCTCVPGYTDNLCQTDINECACDPCQNGAECSNEVNMYRCTCAPGYTGTNCEIDIDECDSDPCQNGATCDEGGIINNYNCTCVPGYTGINCETDIDECASDPCQHNGTCNDAVNRYTCECVDGYTGDICETDIDECASDPCVNTGVCVDEVNGYICECPTGTTGVHCETDFDDCEDQQCVNGGTCTDFINDYSCQCAPGYTDRNCTTDIDECVSQPCVNGGTCSEDGINNYVCRCTSLFTGVNCETSSTLANQQAGHQAQIDDSLEEEEVVGIGSGLGALGALAVLACVLYMLIRRRCNKKQEEEKKLFTSRSPSTLSAGSTLTTSNVDTQLQDVETSYELNCDRPDW